MPTSWSLYILFQLSTQPHVFFDKLNSLDWYASLHQEWISVLNLEKGSSFLELGCGPGHIVKHLVDLGMQVSALDSSEAMLKIAKSRVSEAKFHQGDATQLEGIDGTFDFVIAASLLNIVNNPTKLIDQMKSKTCSGGAVFVLYPNEGFDKKVKEIIRDKKLEGFSEAALRMWAGRPPKMTVEKVEGLFEDAGLTKLTSHTFLFEGIASTIGYKK